MKKIIYIIFCSAFVLLVSCEDEFLEVTPKGRVIAETLTDYDLALNNTAFFSVNGTAQVIMGDEVVAVEPYFSATSLRHQRLFRWEDVIYLPEENAVEMASPMQNIYSYNVIINGVLDAIDGTEAEKLAIQAEALAGRAWTNFLLINYYGKPYNEATASTDLGIPILRNSDVTQTDFERATVQEVYDFIIEDLTTAIANLPLETTSRLRMSKPSAQATLGKVYAFMGKFDEAIVNLEAALDGFETGPLAIELFNYNNTFGQGGSFLPIGLFGPRYPILTGNTEISYGKQFANLWTFYLNEFVLSPEAESLFESSDFRLNFYSGNAYSGEAYPNGMLRRTGPSATQFGVVLPEIYLLLAESKARINDLDGAIESLEFLRKNRMPEADAFVPVETGSNQYDLVKFILEERIREFAMQGFRWFDMRRLSVDPVYSDLVGSTHELYDFTGNLIESYSLSTNRLVLQFPQTVMNQNPNMENNP